MRPDKGRAIDSAHPFQVDERSERRRSLGWGLRPPLEDRHSARRGTYRVLYRIDDTRRLVTVLAVVARADTYRPH